MLSIVLGWAWWEMQSITAWLTKAHKSWILHVTSRVCHSVNIPCVRGNWKNREQEWETGTEIHAKSCTGRDKMTACSQASSGMTRGLRWSQSQIKWTFKFHLPIGPVIQQSILWDQYLKSIRQLWLSIDTVITHHSLILWCLLRDFMHGKMYWLDYCFSLDLVVSGSIPEEDNQDFRVSSACAAFCVNSCFCFHFPFLAFPLAHA